MEEKNEAKVRAAKARSESLTPEQRSEIARKAARVRHGIPAATHVGELEIGDLSISCAVLPDGTRLLSQGSITAAFGPVIGGYQQRKRTADNHDGEMPLFLLAKSLQPFITGDLRTMVSKSWRYKDPRGGPVRVGLEASLLPQSCDVWLKARDAGALTKIQMPVADRAEILMRGLAHTGIIALVDEATGFQYDRAKDALTKILEAFIAKELQPWVRTFPMDFYQELFRLRGLDYPKETVKRPQYFGVLTNDIVYKRIAPHVLDELKRVTPINESGRRKHKFFQRLTQNVGYPKLREHLGSVTTIMKLSDHYPDFLEKLDRIHPRFGDTIPLALDYDIDGDSGKDI